MGLYGPITIGCERGCCYFAGVGKIGGEIVCSGQRQRARGQSGEPITISAYTSGSWGRERFPNIGKSPIKIGDNLMKH